MASNVGEMSGMKDARHMILWLFFGLLPMLGSCDFRDMLDDYPVSGVQIKLDWKGVTDKLPQTMRIIFYPKDTQGRKVESYLPAGGGEVKVPPGKYAVVAYNFNTESIQIRGDESYETMGRILGMCSFMNIKFADDCSILFPLLDVKRHFLSGVNGGLQSVTVESNGILYSQAAGCQQYNGMFS